MFAYSGDRCHVLEEASTVVKATTIITHSSTCVLLGIVVTNSTFTSSPPSTGSEKFYLTIVLPRDENHPQNDRISHEFIGSYFLLMWVVEIPLLTTSAPYSSQVRSRQVRSDECFMCPEKRIFTFRQTEEHILKANEKKLSIECLSCEIVMCFYSIRSLSCDIAASQFFLYVVGYKTAEQL